MLIMMIGESLYIFELYGVKR